ncbi:MAG: hypothetical protein K2M94_04805, partial [Paramuribaculum sp.]|nr:hypothetical protein [Paramuribaculum sp.]
VTSDVTIGASFAKQTFTVTIPEIENGTVTVKNGDTEVKSGDKVEYGTALTFEVTPNEGYELVSLTAGETAVENNSYTVTSDVTIGATFAKQTFTVTIPEIENGTVTVKNGDTVINNGDKVEYGTTLTFEVTPNEGYELVSLTAGETAVENNSYIVTSDVTIGATFAKQTFTVTIPEIENGTVTVKNGDTEVKSGDKVEYGTALTFEVTPNEGYELVSLTAGETAVENNSYTVTSDVTIGATFAKQTFTVTIPEIENGTVVVKAGEQTIANGDKVEYGTVLTFEATPADGYEFESYTIDGNSVEEATVTVYNNVTISATFKKIKEYVLWLFGENGPVEVYSDKELQHLVLADDKSEDGTEITISAKDCEDGLYIVLHNSEKLELVKLMINGSDYTNYVENNMFHIKDVKELMYVDEVGIQIGATYVDKLSSLKSIGIDVKNGDVEFYNLHGVRIPTEKVTEGYYIVRQGTKTVKILIQK